MKCLKMLLWSFMAVFLVVGLFKEGVTNFTDAIVLMLLGTVLLIEGIEYKNNIKKRLSLLYYLYIWFNCVFFSSLCIICYLWLVPAM